MEIRDGFNLDSKREFYLYLVGRYSFPSDIISRLDKFMFPVELIDELEDAAKELRDLMDDVRNGDYKPDSFTNQPIDKALAKIKEFKDKG